MSTCRRAGAKIKSFNPGCSTGASESTVYAQVVMLLGEGSLRRSKDPMSPSRNAKVGDVR